MTILNERDFNVDDMLSRAHATEEAAQLIKQSFKFACKNVHIIEALPPDLRANGKLFTEKLQCQNTQH